ncbi:MAG: hypothetical protein RIR89_1066 [Actinomycetota bacterium]
MLERITGAIKNYDWGSKNLIQDHLSLGEENTKVAEVWFGTHQGGQSQVLATGEALSKNLDAPLSFLAKFLAAESPLSIQVHPNSTQAQAGFESEEVRGVSLSDPTRNYKDPSHKPEILIALTPFRALCGFRPRAEVQQIFLAFSEASPRFGELAAKIATGLSLREIFTELLEDVELATSFPEIFGGAHSFIQESVAQRARSLVLELLNQYPGDTGALVAILLNEVELAPGEAIFLPAGNLHAYISGLGFEVMAASDNVIRGGLTSKHVDRAELLKITDFSELGQPQVKVQKLAEGLVEYPVGDAPFRVYKAEVSSANLLADLDLPAGAMVVCVSGEVAVSTSLEEREVLKKSEVAYLANAKKFSLSGSGTAFVVLAA